MAQDQDEIPLRLRDEGVAGRPVPLLYRLDGPGHGLGDLWRAPMPAVFEALGRMPR